MTSTLVHALTLLLLPPLLPGIIGKVKARFAGRIGPPLLQSYYDLYKLFQKGSVVSRTTTWLFAAGPIVGFVAVFAAGLIVPLGGDAPFRFSGDLILFVYLLGLARVLTTLAAMDAGSAFEGMGVVRELSFACLAEPALLLALLALGRSSHSLSLSGMLSSGGAAAWLPSATAMVFVVVGLFVVLLAENCRVPFDDPTTHLELTMIHEVMVLDHGGPALGFILYGAAMKLLVLGALVARIAVPADTGSAWLDSAIFLAAVAVVTVLVGVVESVMARLRLVQVPRLLVVACLLCGFGFLLLIG